MPIWRRLLIRECIQPLECGDILWWKERWTRNLELRTLGFSSGALAPKLCDVTRTSSRNSLFQRMQLTHLLWTHGRDNYPSSLNAHFGSTVPCFFIIFIEQWKPTFMRNICMTICFFPTMQAMQQYDWMWSPLRKYVDMKWLMPR